MSDDILILDKSRKILQGVKDKTIKSVIIPNSVTRIGEDAFWKCSGLTSIIIPDSVTTIGKYAFSNCSGLTSLTISNSVTKIGDYAFSGCTGLTSVVIPSSVTSIEGNAFYGCSGLNSIVVESGNPVYDSRNNCNAIIETASNTLKVGCMNTIIPDSVTSIGDNAFYNCSSLTSIVIPSSVTSIGSDAFLGTAWYNNQPDGVVYAGNVAYKYKGSMPKNTSITLIDGTKGIAGSAFSFCSNLTSIEIPSSVTSFGERAFYKCNNLTSIVIPNSVKSIGKEAFYDSGLTSVSIPSSVTSIGEEAFSDCGSLSSIEIPNSVTSIGKKMFKGCSVLTLVTIPNSVTSIGIWAFEHCSGLTSIEIPSSVTSIGYGAFRECSGLNSITIPNSVTSIGSDAFIGTAWYDNQPDGVVYAGKVAYKYKGKMPENTKITLIEGTKGISDYAFSNCSGLTSIGIPSTLTCIGTGAFEGCSSLTTISIPNSVTNIGAAAFSDCIILNSVNIGINVKNIGKSAFHKCRRLQKIFIPKSVEQIGEYAFEGCSISKVYLPQSTRYEKNSFDETTKVMKLIVAISYSWDNKEHQAWVKKLADDLEENSIDVILDQNNLSYGAELTSFMEKSISKADRVICIMTPDYKRKTDKKGTGVRYEYSIIKNEIFSRTDIPKNKYIPILREGSIAESCPERLRDYYIMKFKKEDDYNKKLQELIDDILYKTDNGIF